MKEDTQDTVLSVFLCGKGITLVPLQKWGLTSVCKHEKMNQGGCSSRGVPTNITEIKGEVFMERIAERYETGISRNNVPNWTMLHAVKELLQNVVFAKSILEDDISITHDGKYAVIHNGPSGFERGKLLIGESNQRGVIGSPGEYGEGFKMGMLAARRENAECWIETNGFTVRAELEPSAIDATVDVFTLYIEDNDTTTGTTAYIECSKELLEEAKTYFAVLQGLDPERTKSATMLHDFTGIYSNGVKITDTPALYGYNFINAELINRDRSTVDMEKLKEETRSVIFDIKDEEVITEIVKGINSDDSLLESQSGLYGTIALPVWKKVIKKLFGDKVALATGGESDTQARYRKFTVLTNIPKAWGYFFREELKIHPTNELRATTVDTNKHKKASPEENKNLGWAKRLVKLYYADYGTVKVSETLVDEFGNDCLGLHDYVKDVTWIRRDLLSDKEQLFKTLLHETIHRETRCSDNTVGFTKGWEQATWGILNRGKV